LSPLQACQMPTKLGHDAMHLARNARTVVPRLQTEHLKRTIVPNGLLRNIPTLRVPPSQFTEVAHSAPAQKLHSAAYVSCLRATPHTFHTCLSTAGQGHTSG